ncbi:hypothetical protein [Alienimonas californiensis]|uniref:Uncharacterized protein n=1 Tax=Alienimonas californiensis TaxID=2527989 RepID=A0A517P6Z5_9PLAN|nr:hypothetical protein [Alienimonas californiensis]QDT15122.1 hypothetical protein CA12_12030 [Alienimonas californiensis]
MREAVEDVAGAGAAGTSLERGGAGRGDVERGETGRAGAIVRGPDRLTAAGGATGIL